jgi:beta-N-acetylhexosaminidase
MFPANPPAAAIGALYDRNPTIGHRAAFLTGAIIGATCRAMGFTVVCAPVLDLALPGFDAVIGDRGFSANPVIVAELGRAVADGLGAAGIVPVIKHLPGHGRATVDSHLALPERDDIAEDELLPFIRNAELPWAMTAHLLYRAQDSVNPATLSAQIIANIIRGRIGFQGVLVSDDLAMQALSGPPEDRAVAALAAGCDLALYCSGDLAANRAVLAACPLVSPQTQARLATARAWASARLTPVDVDALIREREELLA